MIAIIGGSGLTRLPEMNLSRRQIVRTPYGLPSSTLLFGNIGKLGGIFGAAWLWPHHRAAQNQLPRQCVGFAPCWRALHHLGCGSVQHE